MLVAAGVLADCAPDDIQQRALARYTFLYADALLAWSRRWRNQLKRVPATAVCAQTAKPHIDALATVLDATGSVRDYLAAKRQAVAAMRADDIEGTALLWAAVNPYAVQSLSAAAIQAYDALNQASTSEQSIIQALGLSENQQADIRVALPSRNPDYWHLAADTAADLRPYTLPAAQGGNLGRLIAQINDVAAHLDVLLRIAPLVENALPYDWLVRSAIAVEVSSLLDLTIGPPPGDKYNVLYCLMDLCRRGRAQAAADDLGRLRDSLGTEGWTHIRWLRNRVGAHVDDDLAMSHIHQQLIELDYQGVIRLAEHVLDWLDVLGASQTDLKLLLIGEREIRSWPTDSSKSAPDRPKPAAIPGALARLFRTIDSPYIAAAASSHASGLIAGMMAGRQPKPRPKVIVLTRPNWRSSRLYRPP